MGKWFRKQMNRFRLWLLGEYCKDGTAIIIVHIKGKMRSSRIRLTKDEEVDVKNIKQLGVIAARTMKVMLKDND